MLISRACGGEVREEDDRAESRRPDERAESGGRDIPCTQGSTPAAGYHARTRGSQWHFLPTLFSCFRQVSWFLMRASIAAGTPSGSSTARSSSTSHILDSSEESFLTV